MNTSNIPSPPQRSSEQGPRAVCVEPVPATIDGLKASRDLLRWSAPSSRSGSFAIVHAAAADTARANQTVRFGAPGRLGAGSEIGKILDPLDTSKATVEVPLTTVDQVVEQLALPRVAPGD